MSVRRFLALAIDAGAFVLDGACSFSEGAVGFDRKRSDASPAVIGDEDDLAGGIDRNVAGTGAAGRLAVEQREFSRLRINRERTYCAAALSINGVDFIGRVEKFPVGMNCKEARTGGFGRQTDRVQRAR